MTISFSLLALLTAIAFLVFLIFLVCHIVGLARKKMNPKQLTRLKKAAILFAGLMVLNAGLVAISQFNASTPAIRDERGNTPTGSIAELTQIELNGRKQWVSIRGLDKSKPILLFLAGGPGGTQMAAVRHELGELEKHFIVVGWDQPGSGKSYYAEAIKDIKVETYIQDGHGLTEYLTERFGKEKIILVGESWGSALGIFLIDRYPEYYYAFIGTGQMIDFAETERLSILGD